MTKSSSKSRIFRGLVAIAACFAVSTAGLADTGLFLGSKAPYAPLQDPSTYEPAPAGFSPIFTEIVARHGSRGLSSPSNDLAIYNMWLDAQAKGGLTKAGARLGPDVMRIVQANALLGYGVPGITAPGYGNLTLLGIQEHTQLAQRLAARLSALFSNVAATAPTSPRQILVSTSGVNRAIDSSNFFLTSLVNSVPGISSLIANTPSLTAYPISKPVVQAPGVNRFQLYFHKLAAKTDQPAPTDPYFPVYQFSLQYQTFLASDPTMINKVNSIVYSDTSFATARAVLYALFTPAFVNLLDSGVTKYFNTGSYTFTSPDGKFTTTITGDGGTVINNVVDAVNSLYAVYSITPAMINEVPINMGKYFPPATLPQFGYLSDVQDFYQKGPSITEETPITYQMSQALLDDFINEGNAIAFGNLAHAAKLRFTHAEIMIPFQEKLGLPSASVSVPAAGTYTWDSNPWRGEVNASLAQNIQWDFYTNGTTLLVKMFYNEQETDFPAGCESARFLAGTHSHYYMFSGVKACYGDTSLQTQRIEKLVTNNKMKSTILISLMALAIACGTAHAGPVNLVSNGSFEEGILGIGSFQGWETDLGDINTFVDSNGMTGTAYGDATDGLWAAYFGSLAADGGASIAQDLATTAGQGYTLSFDLANDNGGLPAANDFVVSVGGVPVFTFTNLTDQNYVHEQYTFVASGSSTSLEFDGSNEQSAFELDDVVVAATPEPSALALMAGGLFLFYAGLRRRLTAVR